MAVEWNVTVGNLLTIVGMLIGGISMYVAHIRALDTVRHTATSAQTKADEAHVLAHAAAKAVVDGRLEIEKTFATNASLSQVEDRIVRAIDKLGDRIDRALAKN